MRDPGFVRRDQCIGDLGGVPEDVGRGQWTSREAHGKGLSLEVLHDKKFGLALLPDVVQHADVRMAHRGDCLCLLVETLPQIRDRRQDAAGES